MWLLPPVFNIFSIRAIVPDKKVVVPSKSPSCPVHMCIHA